MQNATTHTNGTATTKAETTKSVHAIVDDMERRAYKAAAEPMAKPKANRNRKTKFLQPESIRAAVQRFEDFHQLQRAHRDLTAVLLAGRGSRGITRAVEALDEAETIDGCSLELVSVFVCGTSTGRPELVLRVDGATLRVAVVAGHVDGEEDR